MLTGKELNFEGLEIQKMKKNGSFLELLFVKYRGQKYRKKNDETMYLEGLISC